MRVIIERAKEACGKNHHSQRMWTSWIKGLAESTNASKEFALRLSHSISLLYAHALRVENSQAVPESEIFYDYAPIRSDQYLRYFTLILQLSMSLIILNDLHILFLQPCYRANTPAKSLPHCSWSRWFSKIRDGSDSRRAEEMKSLL